MHADDGYGQHVMQIARRRGVEVIALSATRTGREPGISWVREDSSAAVLARQMAPLLLGERAPESPSDAASETLAAGASEAPPGNAGNAWTPINHGVSNVDLTDLCVAASGEVFLAANTVVGNSGKYIAYRLAGATLTTEASGDGGALSIAGVGVDNIWLGLSTGGIMQRAANGTWTSIHTGNEWDPGIDGDIKRLWVSPDGKQVVAASYRDDAVGRVRINFNFSGF